jgi:spore maturation protein SpmA
MNVYDAIFLLLPVVTLVAKELLKLKVSLWVVFAAWIGIRLVARQLGIVATLRIIGRTYA